jgi:hypothetical protein
MEEGTTMSWESESISEREKDQAQYRKEVKEDYMTQYGYIPHPNNPSFVDFLLIRMYYEGLPSKEPRI